MREWWQTRFERKGASRGRPCKALRGVRVPRPSDAIQFFLWQDFVKAEFVHQNEVPRKLIIILPCSVKTPHPMTDVKASRKPWSEEEKEKLLQATVDSLNGGMQVQWDAVALQFCDRTKGQLKSFFFNCLKPKMDAACYKQNVPWETRLDRQLCRLVT